jgi:hypothetical protein
VAAQYEDIVGHISNELVVTVVAAQYEDIVGHI